MTQADHRKTVCADSRCAKDSAHSQGSEGCYFSPPTRASEELLERAVIALERIAGALAAEPMPVNEAAVLDTLAKGASLRSCARLHGCKVGIVRGIRNRALANKATPHG